MSYSEIRAVVGGYNTLVLLPDNYNSISVVYHHGSDETCESLLTDSLKAGVVAQILADGYLLSASDAAGNNWGNQAGLDAYTAMQTYIESNWSPVKNGIFSQSMGGCTGLLTVASGAISHLKAWFGIYPVCSLASMFASNTGTFAGDIRTAYGIASDGSDYSTKTAGHDPLLKSAGTYAGVAFRFYASPDDTVVVMADNSTPMNTLVGTVSLETDLRVCSGNHGDPSHFQPTDVSEFLARAFAYPWVATRGM